ncbi:SDR family oxidoreductase [Mitsuaria sp. 7]|uniref:SDR family oxidoreductase n=1 Tax=Mitsuaria sp. 7 TaxID=1658665 RepID=UPI0007DDE712|nr:SDR family oxidoreductase [Mitsuaria sp. 7]ANH66581.1 short-chain dehydrogenase [Mitsuaria sp. 7]
MTKRIALITGANKGIGLETARQLAQAGHRVIVTARQLDAARQAVAALTAEGLEAEALALDIADSASIAAAAADIGHRHGRLDVLVNNAGIMRDAPDRTPSQQSLAAWRETFDTNLFGAIELTDALLPLLKQSDAGRIVNVSSLLGSMATHIDPNSPFYHVKIPAYNISKTALNAWTIHLAYELRGTAIKVNAANPGFVKTDLHGMDAPMSPAEGARTSVQLATLPSDGPTGSFFHEGAVLPW